MQSRSPAALRVLVLSAVAVGVALGGQADTADAARAPKPPAAPIITAKASTGIAGDKLNLTVVIKTSGKVGAASATATVHFASGDVAAKLPKVVKLKNGASLTGTARVPLDEAPGPVTVDLTIVYAGQTYQRTVNAIVEPAPTPTPEPTPEPTPTPDAPVDPTDTP